MQTKDFLAAVLPPSGHGYYCAAELSTNRREHVYVNDIGHLYDTATAFDAAGRETYFALATFKEGTNRTSANASYLRCFFADLDVGESKGYPDVKTALAGLAEWTVNTEFPVPLVVSSGYGFHCYWRFQESIPVAEWLPYARAFKRFCIEKGLRIDATVSADAARVLRVPGTRNNKRSEPRLVRVKSEGDAAKSFDYYKQLLADWKEEKSPLDSVTGGILDNAPDFAKNGAARKTEIAQVSESSFEKIVALGDKGCLQINEYLTNPQKDGVEPLYRSVASVAKFCVEGYDKAFALGKLHPYDDARIHKKLGHINGPQNCATFEENNPGVCANCVNYGKIRNPIALGRSLKAPQAIETVVVGDANTVIQKQEFPDPIQGFHLSTAGVYIMLTEADKVARPVQVADTPFYAVGTYDRAGERYVQFLYKEHNEEKSAVFPLSVATGREEGIKAFSKVGILPGSGNEGLFRAYVRATIAEAKKSAPKIMPTNLGWQADDSFAFHNKIYTANGEYSVPMYGFDNINETTGVKGTLDGWRLVIAGVMRLERWDIIAMMALSFAAPLMRFTGLNGVTFHLCGNDSGRGKTLCQRLASSVWGVPDKFRTTPNTSPIAMINRVGMLGSLPLYVDEITHKGRAEVEWFPEFLSQMSDGRGKDRMESQTNSERRNTTTWSTIAMMTSNKHMMDYLTAERNHGSEGEIRRLIEITFDKELNIDDLTKSLLFDTLPNNYGTAGEAYARWLVANIDTVRAIVKSTYNEVFEQFDATGDERFWIAGCACILAAVRLTSKKHANIVELPLGKIASFLYETIKTMRLETGRMRRTAYDILNEFTKRNYGKLVMVNDRIAKLAGMDIAETLDRRDLCGRVEKGLADGWIDYFIEERELRSFCSSLSYGYNEFKRDIAKVCPVDFIKKDLLMGTKGPSMQVRAIHIRQRVETALDLFDKDGVKNAAPF
jgi:hypothetical protein